ncbi:Homogentisate 1,2-dioxygenase [Legionella massiliensis]|uniref:Homogentisate 1,2-dioxygenase n=1 Tax=Legionella massiliensis TaxID=1034943 RepID=A0A078KZ26_9GAMM|nr:homogentisate 1,2-dioxygenase [Legionella massiliensis]CDZ78191.1 Homogentisate 1,2-dioxygenase [Legionella massiliensis]CEE13929.1 Homogentisate 1,2-dioxygenase [Legionella massiliensis]
MYLAGFGNHHQSEALPGALPTEQNSPQQCAFGLYTEQLSGSAFTRPRHQNLHSWLYRILPSVVHADYEPYHQAKALVYAEMQAPNPYRWSPLSAPTDSQDFVDGLFHLAGNKLCNAFIYQCNKSMKNRYFSNSDGELLLVPYLGEIKLHTEFGQLIIGPGKIAVIPRGIKFKAELSESLACGYICENTGSPLSLPQLGPIGANGLANPRHFLYPQASYEKNNEEQWLICKYQQQFWIAKSQHSPLNVVAWQGNYAPYSYDLSLFNTINTVSFDHPDPSIFTVLTSESNTPGVASLDFVIFPPRWMVAEHTFRPPYFHRNIMSELMGLVYGEYDAKQDGFSPGGVSIHNCMTGHGPDADSYHKAANQELKPNRYVDSLAMMFESRLPWLVSKEALSHPARQLNYSDCWQNLAENFRE